MRANSATQSAVRRALLEATGADDRLTVTQTVATDGWGDVLYVDIYARSRHETLEDLNPALRKAVAVVADRPYERVSIRWRLSNA
jgi:ADP-ribose pyrophosphatase YjhB (NUDIX family)